MNPFVAWAVSWQGTAALMCCALVCGMILGWLTCGQHRIRQERRMRTAMRQRREANRAAAQFRAMRLELHHDHAAIASHSTYAHAAFSGAIDPPPETWIPCVDEAWELHTGQALALVRDDLTDSAYTADMAARTDRLIEYIESLAWVPYSADELWSGQ